MERKAVSDGFKRRHLVSSLTLFLTYDEFHHLAIG